MVTELFFAAFTGVGSWVAGLFPNWSPPSALDGIGAQLTGFLGTVQGLGVWVDWTFIGICVGVALTAWLVGSGSRLVRALIAHIPAIGGSGA